MRTLLITVLAVLLMAGMAFAAKEFDPEPTEGMRVDDPGPDLFGYLRVDPPAGWVFQDISGTGTYIIDGDDSWATYTMGAGFEFYGITYMDVSPSTNGGVTFDYTYMNLSNVCPLPDQNGIFVFNDDLKCYAVDNGGSVYGQYFEVCPLDGGGGIEPCTVIMWDEAFHYGGDPTASWDMELVMFHTSHGMGMLFDERFHQDAGGTIGIDSGNGDVNYCITVACDTMDRPVAGGHYMIQHPNATANEAISFGALKALFR